MLYGKSFDRLDAPRPARFSDPQIEVNLESPRHSILDYSRLSQVQKNASQVAIHLQARGFGKTKEAFDAALQQQRYIFYFDLTQTEGETNDEQDSNIYIDAKTTTGRAYYRKVFDAVREYPAYSKKLNKAATKYTLYLFCSAIVHSEILHSSPVCLSESIRLTPADILNLSFNGNDMRDIVFQKLLEYDVNSVMSYCDAVLVQQRYEDATLVVDEIQETMNTKQIGQVFMHRIREHRSEKKTLYHPFVEGLMKFAAGRIVKRKDRFI
jgi:hypothetical protein